MEPIHLVLAIIFIAFMIWVFWPRSIRSNWVDADDESYKPMPSTRRSKLSQRDHEDDDCDIVTGVIVGATVVTVFDDDDGDCD